MIPYSYIVLVTSNVPQNDVLDYVGREYLAHLVDIRGPLLLRNSPEKTLPLAQGVCPHRGCYPSRGWRVYSHTHILVCIYKRMCMYVTDTYIYIIIISCLCNHRKRTNDLSSSHMMLEISGRQHPQAPPYLLFLKERWRHASRLHYHPQNIALSSPPNTDDKALI